MNARDKLARFLPGWLVDELKEGFGRLATEIYRPPSNETEAAAFHELTDQGYAVFRRGWPDFLVFAGQDDIFLMEVKDVGDHVRPAQRVILEALAAVGIHVYIRWSSKDGNNLVYEAVGQTPEFWERKKRWKAA